MVLRAGQRLALQLDLEPFVLGGVELRLGSGEPYTGGGEASAVATKQVRVGQLALQGGRCFYCPAALTLDRLPLPAPARAERRLAVRAVSPDHFYPFAQDGSDRPWNVVLACVPCNEAKGGRMPALADQLRFFALREAGVFIPPAPIGAVLAHLAAAGVAP